MNHWCNVVLWKADLSERLRNNRENAYPTITVVCNVKISADSTLDIHFICISLESMSPVPPHTPMWGHEGQSKHNPPSDLLQFKGKWNWGLKFGTEGSPLTAGGNHSLQVAAWIQTQTSNQSTLHSHPPEGIIYINQIKSVVLVSKFGIWSNS